MPERHTAPLCLVKRVQPPWQVGQVPHPPAVSQRREEIRQSHGGHATGREWRRKRPRERYRHPQRALLHLSHCSSRARGMNCRGACRLGLVKATSHGLPEHCKQHGWFLTRRMGEKNGAASAGAASAGNLSELKFQEVQQVAQIPRVARFLRSWILDFSRRPFRW